MDNNYEPLFALVLGALLAGGTALIAYELSSIETCEAPAETGWSPPNVQLCPEEIGLWECVRDAAYREDI